MNVFLFLLDILRIVKILLGIYRIRRGSAYQKRSARQYEKLALKNEL